MAKFDGDYSDIVHLRAMRCYAKEWLNGRDSTKSDINEQAVAAILELFFLEEIKFDIEKKEDKLYGKFNALSGDESALSALTESQQTAALDSAVALMDLELGVKQENLVKRYEKADISTLKTWIYNNQKGSFSGIENLRKDAWIKAARGLLYESPYSSIFIKHIRDKEVGGVYDCLMNEGLDPKSEEFRNALPLLLAAVLRHKYQDSSRILSLIFD